VTPEDIAALCHPYWSNDKIVEALVMASHSAWTTTVAQALHLEDDPGTPEFAGYFLRLPPVPRTGKPAVDGPPAYQ
jgi:hypothetical protein